LWIEEINDLLARYKGKVINKVTEITFGITFQNNIRFFEIWFELGVGTLVFAFDKIGDDNGKAARRERRLGR
jgi:hypothetical protein